MNISAKPSECRPEDFQLFDALPQAALIVGRDGIVRAVNPLAEREILARPLRSFGNPVALADLFEGGLDALRRAMIAGASGGRVTFRLRNFAGDGDRRRDFQVAPLRSQDQPVDAFLIQRLAGRPIGEILSNLTVKLRKANQESARKRQDLKQLQENYRELSRFSHAAAHDLKAPLRKISFLLEMLHEDQRERLDAEGIENLDAARNAAVQLQSLISDLLAHARTGVAALEKRPLQLAELVDTVRDSLSTLIDDVDGQVLVEGDLGEVVADAILTQRLLQNIIGNAIKYCAPDRPLAIRLYRRKNAEGGDELVIRDNGLGFDNAEKAVMFEPFRRLSHTSQIEGSGIGLATCRQICDRHGWTLDADGRPGEGATFVIGNIG